MQGLKPTFISTLAIGLLAGSAVGVAAQVAPVEFTARWAGGPMVREISTNAADDVVQYRHGAFRPQVLVAASDPRLTGDVSLAVNWDEYAASGGPRVVNYAFRIENDGGAWQQLPTINIVLPEGDVLGVVGVFAGEGEYEGLNAVFDNVIDSQTETFDLHGYIIEAELPPAPEPYVTE